MTSVRLCNAALVLLICGVVPAAFAQTDVDTTILAGRILPPSLPPPQTTGIAPAIAKIMEVTETPQPRYQLLFMPLYLGADELWAAQVTTGVILPARNFRATATYGYIQPDGASDHVDSYGAAVRWKPWEIPKRAGFTLIGSYADNRDVSRKSQVGAVGELFVGGPLTVSADVRWVQNDAVSTVEDIVATGAGALNFGRAIVAAGYTIKNDIAREDDFSVELQVPTRVGAFVGAVGKHGTWRLNFIRVFGGT